jgi:hypothetical protein
MPVGFGGLVTEALSGGDLNQQLANALAGPNPTPNPNAPPGAAPPTAPAPGQTPAQSYAPDPQNANTIALLLKVHQQDAISNDLNRNIAGIAAGFGTAQQQHDKQEALNHMGPGDDRLAALQNIEQITGEQTKQNEHARFMAGADLLGQQILGLKPGQGATMAAGGLMPQLLQSHFQGLQPTDAIKDYNAARQALREQGLSEDEINQRIPPDMLVSAIGGQTPVEKDLRNDIRMWKAAHPDGTTEQMYAEHPGWTTLTGYAAEKAEETKTAAVAATDKLNSKANLSDVEKTSKPITDNLDDLINNFDHTVTAIKYPEVASGAIGRGFGAAGLTDQKTLDMRVALNTLQQQLKSDSMHNMKNIRTQREFDAIGGAASGIFDPNNSPEKIKQGLLDLKTRFGLAHANAIASAGGEVPAEYADQVNRDYLTKGSPLYNGATVEKVPDFSGMTGPQADAAVAALPPGGKFRGPDGKIHTRN